MLSNPICVTLTELTLFSEAEGRLTVLVTYRKNYSDTGRIRGHIVAAGDAVNGAKQAVNQMKKHRQGMISLILLKHMDIARADHDSR